MRVKWIETCARAALPRKRHTCTTSRSPRRTKPEASSLPPNDADPATSRPRLPKTPRSQSPAELSRTLTSPRAGAFARISFRPVADDETSSKQERATALPAVTVRVAAADGTSTIADASTAAPTAARNEILIEGRPYVELDDLRNRSRGFRQPRSPDPCR